MSERSEYGRGEFCWVDLHVRLVEEPYLAATHGSSYASYAARVGRFVPGMGKFAPPTAGK